MKNFLLFSLSLLFSNVVLGQNGTTQVIPGTKYSLIPPKGFVTATSFSGFQNNESGASIMVVEVPAPIQLLTEEFTADALKAKGMTLIEKELIDFQASKATLIKVSQKANGVNYLKIILLFGDTEKTVLVNGIYPETAKSIEDEIRTSLLSTTYHENQTENPLDAVKFRIDVAGTDFKLAKFMAGSLIFTTDGQIPSEKASFIAGGSISKVAFENQKQYCLDRLKALPGGESIQVEAINPVQIDNLPGYEIVSSGKHTLDKNQLIYQVMLFNGSDEYFILIGIATEDHEKNLATFKKIAATFRLK